MQEQIQAFLLHMTANRGASRNTIDAYGSDLSGFSDFALELQAGVAAPDADTINAELVSAYVEDLRGRLYAPSTVARKIASLRSFCGYLEERGTVSSNPAAHIDSPRAPRPERDPLSTEEIDQLLRIPAGTDTLEGARDAAWLELIYATGMRVTELASLNVGDVHRFPPPAYVRCAGPGKKERTIPVHERALEALAHYLNEARPKLLRNTAEPALFINRRGERLTRQGFWLIVKGYSRRAGMAERVTPQRLRDSFATHMLDGGASLNDLQSLLGHAQKATTQIYTRTAPDHARSIGR